MIQPYYSDSLVTLYHADCREITDWLRADVLVTDPPYGRAWKQGVIQGKGAGRTRGNKSEPNAGIAHDSDTVVRDSILSLWGEKIAVVFGDLMLTPPFGNRQTLIYRKAPASGVRGATGGRRRDVEAIYLIGPWPSSLGGKTSVIETRLSQHSGAYGLAARYGHPHAKPVDVMAELVGMTEGVIADPFAGSGSTLVAAAMLGRHAIGVEIEERYCERAANRLSVPDLFLASS